MSEIKIHPQSEVGYSAGDEYDKARPSYPDNVLAYIKNDLGKYQNLDLNIVEFGCGSGKFTKSLLANVNWSSSIVELHCVEPVEGMLKVLRETVQDPRVMTYRGTFDDSGIQKSAFADLIVAATSYHWCLDNEAALKEFLRLLKADGNMCFLWNMEDRQTATWLEEFMQITEANRDQPRTGGAKAHNVMSDGVWRRIFDLPLYKEAFDPPTETTFRFITPSTFDTVWARCRTWSGVGSMSEETKEQMKEALKNVIQTGHDLVYIDKDAGVFEVPSVVPVLIMKRRVK